MSQGNKDRIAKVAYDLFERRGFQHGRHIEDWVEAERIVNGGPLDGEAKVTAPRTGVPAARAGGRRKSK